MIGIEWRFEKPETNQQDSQRNLWVTDKGATVWIGLPRAGPSGRTVGVSIPSHELTSGRMFEAVFQSRLRDQLSAHLLEELPDSPFMRAVVQAFIDSPAGPLRLRDLLMRYHATAKRIQFELQDIGFRRLDHLRTQLRAESWIWLISKGLSRRVVEHFLGLDDRSDFRRACRRASIKVPWEQSRLP